MDVSPVDGSFPQISTEAAQAAHDSELGGLRQTVEIMKGTWNFKYRDTGARVHEFDAGLVNQRSAAAPEVFRWDHVTTAYQDVTHFSEQRRYKQTDFSYRLTRSDGATMNIAGSYRDPARSGRDSTSSWLYRYAMLGKSAAEHVAQAQLPSAVAALNRGESLAFGDIVITSSGVQGKHGTAPWPSILDVQVKNGYVRIKMFDKLLSLSAKQVRQIPNFLLFVALAERLSNASQP
jgi:hypothetical protein